MTGIRAAPATALAALVVALVLIAAAYPAQAAGLGRLFFTPEQRSSFERQRSDPDQQHALEDSATLVINGVVRRSDGKTTVWINGVPQQHHSKIRIFLAPQDPSRVTLGIDGGVPIRLRVGEAVDRATRERRDGLAGGSIIIHGGPR